jgi:hypothetical protein
LWTFCGHAFDKLWSIQDHSFFCTPGMGDN